MNMIKEISLNELKNKNYHENVKCAWENMYNGFFQNMQLFNSLFERVVLKGATFKNVNIKHCLMVDCYFRGAKFIGVDFTGTNFKGCNFKNAQFINCKFDYATFHECELNERKIIYNLGERNIINKMIILELRKNALSMGKNSTNDKLIMLEKEYLRKYLVRKLFNKNQRGDYKVQLKEKSRILFNLSRLYLGFFIWGYGIQIYRLIITAALTILTFAGIYHFSYNLSIIESISTSLIMFSTVGYVTDLVVNQSNHLVFGLEGLLGAIFIALLASALYRKITR